MRFPFFIALRYFFAKRSIKFAQVITLLSVVSIAFSTAALVIVLSVFNGLEDLMRRLYAAFDPLVKIEAAQGKSFVLTDSLRQQIESTQGALAIVEVIEDNAYARYRDAGTVARIKGFSSNYAQYNRMGEYVEGNNILEEDSLNYAVVGSGIQQKLSLSREDIFTPLQIYYISRQSSSRAQTPYKQRAISVGGTFSVQQDLDENYIFVPLRFAQSLFDYNDKRTSLEIIVDAPENAPAVAAALRKKIGSKFRALTNEQQHADLYRLFQMEKLFTSLSLGILILIGSVNIFLSLLMLILEKKKDISVLSSMGASAKTIRQIYLLEGCVIAGAGCLIGLGASALICFAQQEFGLISIGAANSIIAAYPVLLRASDFVWVFAGVICVAGAVSLYPAYLAAKTQSVSEL